VPGRSQLLLLPLLMFFHTVSCLFKLPQIPALLQSERSRRVEKTAKSAWGPATGPRPRAGLLRLECRQVVNQQFKRSRQTRNEGR